MYVCVCVCVCVCVDEYVCVCVCLRVDVCVYSKIVSHSLYHNFIQTPVQAPVHSLQSHMSQRRADELQVAATCI